MASLRNFVATNMGVVWDMSFEFNYDDQSGSWILWEGQIPRDLQDLDAANSAPALWELAQHIARGQGVGQEQNL